jgi:hypothetical protein
MTDYRYEIRALIDPEQTERLAHGSVLQHVSVIMTDPPDDEHSAPSLPPAAVTLRPEEARLLAGQLLQLADQAQRMRPSR